MNEAMPPLEMIYKSKCWNCVHRLTRTLEPVLQEELDYYLSIVDLEQGDEYDLVIEQHRCLLTDEDIEGIVRECSQYTSKRKYKFMKDYQF